MRDEIASGLCAVRFKAVLVNCPMVPRLELHLVREA